MRFPQSRVTQALAASLSVAVLAGCPNAGTAPSINSVASPAAVASADAAATPGSSTSAAPIGSTSTAPSTSGPTAAPTSGVATSNPAPTGALTILQGKVYNEAGASVDGATVSVRSLDKRQPYTATATTSGGNYVVNNVPVGVQVEVSVTKDGFTRRTRVTSLQSDVSVKNVLDFGSTGAATQEDPTGLAYFISDYPEVASATPGASPIKGDKLNYTIRFSEALDEDNRDLVQDSFSLDTTAVEAALLPKAIPTPDLSAAIVIEKGSTFLDHTRKLIFTWNADNTAVTVEFNAPLRTVDDEDKSYRFRLIRRAGDDSIEDQGGKVLGQAAPAAGESYLAIKKANLAVAAGSNTAALRWENTHQRSSSFDVAEDDVDPTLSAVEASRETKNSIEYQRVDLTFSEPMRVYPDNSGYSRSLEDVANYAFAFGEDPGDLDGVDMEDAAQTFPANLTNTELGKPMKFNATNFGGNPLLFEPSDSDPNVFSVFIPNAFFTNNNIKVKEIKVLVDTNVLDPAGNRMSEKNLDTTKRTADNVAIGKI